MVHTATPGSSNRPPPGRRPPPAGRGRPRRVLGRRAARGADEREDAPAPDEDPTAPDETPRGSPSSPSSRCARCARGARGALERPRGGTRGSREERASADAPRRPASERRRSVPTRARTSYRPSTRVLSVAVPRARRPAPRRPSPRRAAACRREPHAPVTGHARAPQARAPSSERAVLALASGQQARPHHATAVRSAPSSAGCAPRPAAPQFVHAGIAASLRGAARRVRRALGPAARRRAPRPRRRAAAAAPASSALRPRTGQQPEHPAAAGRSGRRVGALGFGRRVTRARVRRRAGRLGVVGERGGRRASWRR